MSSGASVPVTRAPEPRVDAELNKRCNDLIEQTLGPQKGLFLAESEEGPVSRIETEKGELAILGPKDKKRAPESDAGEPALSKTRFDGNSPRNVESMGRRRESAAPPPPYFPRTQRQYRSFLILGASVDVSQDENLRGRLARLVSVPAPMITLIHLQPQKRVEDNATGPTP